MPATLPATTSRFARTRIVCTVGPACEDVAVLAAMIRAGADVLRVNGAHASEADVAAWGRRVRAARGASLPGSSPFSAALMIDLPGVKMRVGAFEGGAPIELEAGARVELCPGRQGGLAGRIPVHPWPDPKALRKGGTVLLDDGRLRLTILARRGSVLRTEVVHGGRLASGKGVAFPGAPIGLDVPTRRDLKLARAAVAAGADWVNLSFVRAPEDVRRLKRALRRAGAPHMPVAAKIERADAFAQLEQILVAADAAIVARGDLGVDVGAENVPALQKRIIETARRVGCPVVVATEMLDSMTVSERPTRAEVSDVAGAVFEGTDAVMLSGETAVGKHPALAVETMNRILLSAEADSHALYAGSERLPAPTSLPGRPDQHVVHAAVTLASQTNARAIVVFSRSGASAFRLSKERPRSRVHAFAPRDEVCRKLNLAWGVSPRRLPGARSTDALIAKVVERLRSSEHLCAGDRAVLVMGSATDPGGATTMIKLLTL